MSDIKHSRAFPGVLITPIKKITKCKENRNAVGNVEIECGEQKWYMIKFVDYLPLF
jgi:hypothetical protein